MKDKLASVAVINDDEDLVLYALNGLPSEYNVFQTAMRVRDKIVTFDQLHVLLVSEEATIAKQVCRVDSFSSPIALLDTQSQNSVSRHQNFGSSFNIGRGSSSSDRVFSRGFFGHNPVPAGSSNRGRAFSFKNSNDNSFSFSTICQICNKPRHAALDFLTI